MPDVSRICLTAHPLSIFPVVQLSTMMIYGMYQITDILNMPCWMCLTSSHCQYLNGNGNTQMSPYYLIALGRLTEKLHLPLLLVILSDTGMKEKSLGPLTYHAVIEKTTIQI